MARLFARNGSEFPIVTKGSDKFLDANEKKQG